MDESYSKSTNQNFNNSFNNELNDKKEEKMKQIKIANLCSPLLKIIFSFLKSENKKLSIINNNKKIQKKLDINIENYKQICKRYKIGERNGKGKIYISDGTLIFEGEYIDNIKNGKGKEYYWGSGKLEYEGEYLDGKKNGKFKEYYENGNLKTEGELIYGKKMVNLKNILIMVN